MHWLLYRSDRAGCERHCEGVSCLNFCPHVAKINDNQNKINNKDKLYHCLDGLVKICVGNCWIAPVEASVTDFTCGFVYQSLLLPAEGLLDWSTQQSSGEKLSALSMHQEDCYKSMLYTHVQKPKTCVIPCTCSRNILWVFLGPKTPKCFQPDPPTEYHRENWRPQGKGYPRPQGAFAQLFLVMYAL